MTCSQSLENNRKHFNQHQLRRKNKHEKNDFDLHPQLIAFKLIREGKILNFGVAMIVKEKH